MKIVIQRVNNANVKVENQIIGLIEKGLLLLVAFEDSDKEKISAIAQKILKLRIFSDEKDKMNLSILEVKGELLVVPQFTLLADCSSGNRPYFGNVAGPKIAENLFLEFVLELKKSGLKVETGKFGAKMQVSLVNDGPVTIIIG